MGQITLVQLEFYHQRLPLPLTLVPLTINLCRLKSPSWDSLFKQYVQLSIRPMFGLWEPEKAINRTQEPCPSE